MCVSLYYIRKPLTTKRADSEEEPDANGVDNSDGELESLPEGQNFTKLRL